MTQSLLPTALGCGHGVHTLTHPSLCKQRHPHALHAHPDSHTHTQVKALALGKGGSQGPEASGETFEGWESEEGRAAAGLTVKLRLAHADDDDGHGEFGSLGDSMGGWFGPSRGASQKNEKDTGRDRKR